MLWISIIIMLILVVLYSDASLASERVVYLRKDIAFQNLFVFSNVKHMLNHITFFCVLFWSKQFCHGPFTVFYGNIVFKTPYLALTRGSCKLGVYTTCSIWSCLT